jgi:arylsulfatase A-like enzyme
MRVLATRISALLVIAAALLHVSCGGDTPTNVLIVSLDTLRPDHLGCYGYERNTSPEIDRFCRDAIRFDRAIAQAPSTLPSHASMLTSTLPRQHAAFLTRKSALASGVTTLPEILRAAGYTTVSYNGGAQLAPEWGLDRGFDIYESVRPKQAHGDAFSGQVDRFDHTVEVAARWFREQRAEPFFAFLHSYEVHHPYTPTAENLRLFERDYSGELPRDITASLLRSVNRGSPTLTRADFDHIVSTYDAEIRSADAAFGDLMAFLRARGLYDEMLIVLMSDHGEEFGEHGLMGWHSHTLYDELLRVPLVIKLPNSRFAGRVVTDPVRLIDVAPTVLEVLGLPPAHAFVGESLLAFFEAQSAVSRPAISQQDTARRDVLSLRTDRWKLYRGKLFDLEADRLEQRDVAGTHPEIAASLQARLDELLEQTSVGEGVPSTPEPETRERLQSLGYIE